MLLDYQTAPPRPSESAIRNTPLAISSASQADQIVHEPLSDRARSLFFPEEDVDIKPSKEQLEAEAVVLAAPNRTLHEVQSLMSIARDVDANEHAVNDETLDIAGTLGSLHTDETAASSHKLTELPAPSAAKRSRRNSLFGSKLPTLTTSMRRDLDVSTVQPGRVENDPKNTLQQAEGRLHKPRSAATTLMASERDLPDISHRRKASDRRDIALSKQQSKSSSQNTDLNLDGRTTDTAADAPSRALQFSLER